MPNFCNWYIAIRYLRAKNLKYFFGFLPVVVIIAVVLSLFIVLSVKSIFNGFQNTFAHNLTLNNPHISIVKDDNRAFSVDDELLIDNHLSQISNVLKVKKNIKIDGLLTSDAFKVPVVINSESSSAISPNGIVIPYQLAERFGLQVGMKLKVLAPKIGVSLFGVNLRQKQFVIEKILPKKTNDNVELFNNVVFINFNMAKKLFLLSNINEINLYIKDIFASKQLASELRNTLNSDNNITDWTEQNKVIYDAIQIEQTAIIMLLSLIFIVAAVNIFSVLLMLINNRSHDIGILLTMGLGNKDIMLVYFICALVMAMLGILFGNILTYLFINNIPHISNFLETYFDIYLLNGSHFGLTYMPGVFTLKDSIITSTIALLIILISAIYPVMKISNLSPIKVLNYAK